MAVQSGFSELEKYPTSVSEWVGYAVTDVRYYLFLFVVFTVLAFLSRGKIGLVWTRKMRISALASYGILQFNLFIGFVFFAAVYYVEETYNSMRLPQIPEGFWDQLPAPLVWLILLFVYDLAVYWIHRIMHDKWLWPVHAVHHSDEDMHFLSWSRGHVFEQVIMAIFVFLCSAWLGISIEEFFLLAYIRSMHQYYVHANIDWDHGPFRTILVSPQYHRWHHANVEEAYDKNFASIFPFIDKMFGTYYFPHSAVNVPTGFNGSPGNNVFLLILYPMVRWYEMIRKRLGKARRSKPSITPGE